MAAITLALETYLKARGFDCLHAVAQNGFAGRLAIVCCDGQHRLTISIEPGAATDTIALVEPLPSQRRPATVNERMLAMLEADPQRISWSARRWAAALECSPSTVTNTGAWRRLLTARALARAEATERRRGR